MENRPNEKPGLSTNNAPSPEGITSLTTDLVTGAGEDQASLPSEPLEDYAAWLQVFGAFSLNLNTWGLMSAYGVFQTFYQLSLFTSESPSTISWIGSTQSFLMFITSIVAGPLFDKGYLQPLLWSGTLLVVLGMFLTSICEVYWQTFLAQGIIVGLGFGCLYLPAPAIISQRFHKRRALAIGISSIGSGLGGVIYPITFTHLQPHIGFRWATRVIAFVILGTSLAHLTSMKSCGRATVPRSLLDTAAFRDIPYILFNFGLLFGFMGLYIVFYYIQLYALQETSVPSKLASYLLVIINASSLPGRLIPAFYADKVGPINVQTIVSFICALLTFCLIAIKKLPGILAYCVLYGFFAGAFMGLPPAGVARLSAGPRKIGTRLGMTLAFVGFGMLVSNPIAGAILTENTGWDGLVGWCGALLTASALSMAASRITKIGFGFRKVV